MGTSAKEKAKTVKGLIELSQGFEKDAVLNTARLFREKNGAVKRANFY